MTSYTISSSLFRSAWALFLILVPATVFAVKGSGAFVANPTSIAFGSVTVGSSLSKTATISNTGTATLTAASASVGGAAFGLSGLTFPTTLAPGQSVTFQVIFAPTMPGSTSGSVTFNRSNGQTLGGISLSGTGVAPDTTAPTVTVTAPGNGATISGTVALTANASDNVGVVGVQFFVNNTAIGTEVTTAPYTVSWNTSTTANGSGYIVTAKARDAAGNQSMSAGVSTTVSNLTVQHSASLRWASSPSVVLGYYVYRSTQRGGPYARVTTTIDPSTMFTDSTVSGGQTYYYVVTAVDAKSVESGYSNETVATIPN